MTAEVKLGVYHSKHIKGSMVTIKVNKSVLDALGIDKNDTVEINYTPATKLFTVVKSEMGRKIYNHSRRENDYRISIKMNEKLNPLTLYVPDYKIENNKLMVFNVRGK